MRRKLYNLIPRFPGARARRRDHFAAPLDDLEPVVFRRLRDDPQGRPWHFVSLRWQVIVPLALVVLAFGMLAAYLVADALMAEAERSDIDRVLRASRAVADRMSALNTAQQREVTRIAYTEGVAEAVAARDMTALHALLEPLAAAGDLDVLLIAAPDGQEIIGLQRVVTAEGALDYAVATGTDLTGLLAATPALGGAADLAGSPHAVFTRTGQEYALLTTGPIYSSPHEPGALPAGTVIAGQHARHVLDNLRGGDGADLALFASGGEFVRTTLPFDDSTRGALSITPEQVQQALTTPGEIPVAHLTIQDRPYRAAYIPLVIGGTPLGVAGVYLEDGTFYAAVAGRDTLGLLSAALAGVVIVLAYALVGRFSRRVERVTRTASALAAGDARARTGMRARDEIGELGATLDRMAERHERRTDALNKALRKQRADSARLTAILESIPDGIVVQDLDGRVLLINDAAREMLGGQRGFRAARLHDLTALVTETLGPALAPGIYALGDPRRVPLEERILQAQAAAIQLKNKQRIGTVIVLRDITEDVRREQAREDLLDRLSEHASAPAISTRPGESLSALAQEFVRNTRAIQRVIADLRDLSTFDRRDLESGQQPLPVNALIWHIAAEWEPLARAARSRLHVSFGLRGAYVLGDERRLRWAVGNLIDNALKYSPPGSPVTLSARPAGDNPEAVEIVIADEGYGMTPDDLANAFTRFYRGTPRDSEGWPVRKPGTGQGLYIARRVFEAHGGTLALESRQGAGTTAIIRLPLTAPVALELPEHDSRVRESDRDLPDTPYNTVPLEPRRPPWEEG